MPTYDYACKQCGHRFEAFQSMKDPLLTTCPQCATESLQRLIGAGAGLVFKGSGFYLTDYKKSGSTPATPSSSGTNGSGSTTSTDSASGDSGASTASATSASITPPKATGTTDS